MDYDIIARHSKPLFGLSDVTAVQNALVARASTPAYTGFLPVYDIKNDSLNSGLETSLKNILFAPVHCLKSGTSLYPGKAEGQIIGGCLTSFLYLAGTNYMPDLAGKILLIEDTDEKTYKLDLMFSQLKQLKILINCTASSSALFPIALLLTVLTVMSIPVSRTLLKG